jgi:hypothetical protein
VQDSANVIIRNLKVSFVLGNDGITIQNSTRLWIDRNEFESDISKGLAEYVVGYLCQLLVLFLSNGWAAHYGYLSIFRTQSIGYCESARLDLGLLELLLRSTEGT